MKHQSSDKQLQQLGYDDWFRTQSESHLGEDFSAARIVEVNKNQYKVSSGTGEIPAELAGRFMFTAESTLDYPTVGDWVAVQYFDDQSLAIIHQLFPRKTVLKRKDPGKKVDFQLIAANIDYAIIMQSADTTFNINRLERYLVMANESGIIPIIVLSKIDLCTKSKADEINTRLQPYSDKYRAISISTKTGDGMELMRDALVENRTYCLLGSSGVGKTTLLNALVGEELFEVNEVRTKDHKGRHTTVRRQMIRLDSGSIFIDTPGMRKLGNFGVDTGLQQTFDDIAAYGKKCRFTDCTHTHEPDCVVLEAVQEGAIDEDHYRNYLKIRKEAAYNKMSYVEKRQKDKAFGKMVKNIKKSMRKK